MGLRSTDLPIVRACPLDAAPEGWCDHCSHRVHALSSMREHEVRALVEAHRGETLCVDYRVRSDGTIELAPERPRRWLAPLIASVTACSVPEEGMTLRPSDAAWADAQAGCAPVPRLLDTPAPEPANVKRVDFEMPVGRDAERRLGMVGYSTAPMWTPTKKLWREFADRVRARWAARAR